MASAPLDIAGLTAWYRADDCLGIDGDTISTWLDASGNGCTLADAGATPPTLRLNGPNGHRYLEWGVDTYLDSSGSGKALSAFMTTAAGTVIVLAKIDVIDTNSATIANNDAIWAHSANSAGLYLRNTTQSARFYANDAAPQEATRAIATGQWRLFIWRHGGGTLYGHDSDPDTSASQACGALTSAGGNLRVGANGALTQFFNGWSVEMVFYNVNLSALQMARWTGYLKAKYLSPAADVASDVARGDAIEQTRDVASRILWERAVAVPSVNVNLPFRATDHDLLEYVWLAHPRGLDPDGAAGGWPPSNPRRMMLDEATWDLSGDEMTVSVHCEDARS